MRSALCSLLIPLMISCQAAVAPPESMPETVSEPPAPKPHPDAVRHMLAAKRAERRKHPQEAATEWLGANRVDPNSPTLKLGLARAMLELNDDVQAVANAEESIELDSTFLPAYKFLEDYYRAKGENDLLIHYLARDLRISGDRRVAQRLFAFYNALNRTGDIEQTLYRLAAREDSSPRDVLEWARLAGANKANSAADSLYRTLLSRWPGSVDGVLRYGGQLDRDGRTNEAEAVYRAGMAARPASKEIAQKLVWLLVGLERWTAADSVMGDIEVGTANDLTERKAWLSVLMKRGQSDLVVGDLERLLVRFPNDADLHVLLGQARVDRGDYQGAAAAFESAVQRDSSIQALTGLVFAYVHSADLPSAATAARAAARLSPGNAPRLSLAMILREQGKWDEAATVFEEVVRSDSTNTNALFDWASSLERSERFSESEAAFRRLLRQDPEHAAGLNYLGYMFADRGSNLDEAYDLIRRATLKEPRNGAFLDSMGWVLYRLGRHEEALSFLRKADEYASDDATILDHLGEASRALGNVPEARDYWQRALRLDPDNQPLRTKLDALPSP